MGKTGKWIKNFLTGKKDKEKETENPRNQKQISANGGGNENRPTIPSPAPHPTTPREKRRWSFRRSSATALGRHETNAVDNFATAISPAMEADIKKRALVLATAAAADAAAAAAKAAAGVIQMRAAASGRGSAPVENAAAIKIQSSTAAKAAAVVNQMRAAESGRGSAPVENAAAIKIQSCFRGFLARKASNALKGLVKLQALVRGHLVRKQAAAALRCMQALVNVQARAQRLRMAADETKFIAQKKFNHRKSSQDAKFRTSNEDLDKSHEENIKIVEMDLGGTKLTAKPRNSCSNHKPNEPRVSTPRASLKLQERPCQISPSPSAITETSPQACSNHFEEYSFQTTQSSAQCHTPITCKPDQARLPFSYPRSECAEPFYNEFSFYPNYMANTESSKAKLRSHSAPKQRPVETFKRQLSRARRPSLEGRINHAPKAVRMQRSSSQVGSKAENYPNSYSVKLDKSNVSIKESECGSTSTIMSNATYSRSLMGIYDISN